MTMTMTTAARALVAAALLVLPVIDGLASASDAFFLGLDTEQKLAYRTPPGVNRGYSPPKSEATSLSLGVEPANKMNDFFEAFNVVATAAHYPHAPRHIANHLREGLPCHCRRAGSGAALYPLCLLLREQRPRRMLLRTFW